ncbi:MAG: acyltransferase, partial [Terriglobia bacterium]|nr:acyltransferase [Terriglobia bacterium]
MTSKSRVPELDGIRGIAILLVVLLHFGARPSHVPRILTAPFALGWTGVDLFFVLSGFLITGILLDTTDRPRFFSTFWFRRFLRIFPAYWLLLALYFLILRPTLAQHGIQTKPDGSEFPWFMFYAANWMGLWGLQPGLLDHCWSLCVEEQFYLIWPLVIKLVGRRLLPAVCTAIVVLAVTVTIIFHGRSDMLYQSTLVRMEPIAIGAMIALAVRNHLWVDRVRKLLPLILISSLLLVIFVVLRTGRLDGLSPQMQTIGYSGFAGIYGCLVFAGYLSSGTDSILSKILSLPFLQSFGAYSYAIYLFHVPLSTWQNSALMYLAAGRSTSLQILLWC